MNSVTMVSGQNGGVWRRGLYMLLFMFLLGVAKFLAFAVILFQFVNVLLTTRTNQNLLRFGNSLSIYHYQVMLFLTYNSEEHPYPIGSWPISLHHQLD